ncbi:MAG: hypothetical protein PH343_04170 [Nitrospira sp.]|nr:hypothetical protein [Nitrospira sp.]
MIASPPKPLSKPKKSHSWIMSVFLVGFLLVSLQAYQVHASVDSDGDGLSDDQELQLGTNPNNPDTDGDGMPDGYEVSHGLNPLSSADASLDNDHDGLSNLAEYTAGTDPNNRDSDGDRIPDGYEASHGLNPLDPADAALDSDQDGTSNLAEYHAGTDPNSHDNSVDGNGDGIPDNEEEVDSEHPTQIVDAGTDSDGDGFSNLEEHIGQSDPLDPLSIPNSQTVMDGNNQPIRMVTPPNVTINSFTWIDPSTLPQANTPGATFPYGLVGFDLTVTTPGEHIKVALTFPGPVDPLSNYDHFSGTITNPSANGNWVSYTVGSNDGDATIILNLTDGGEGDDDQAGDGTIHDPGGPALFTNAKMGGISSRAGVQTGIRKEVAGFIISGTQPKTVMIRGRGPSMGGAPYNLPGVLANPTLRLYSGQNVIAQNDDWQTSDSLCSAPAVSCGGAPEITASGMDPCQPNAGQTIAPPNCSRESAIYVTLPPGAYTATLNGVNNGTGVGIVEVYEVSSTGTEKLQGISTRSFVGTATSQLVGGVIVQGTSPKTVVIRGRGPSMGGAPYNLSGVLANPNLQLLSGQTVIAQNDDWQTTDSLCAAPAVACGGASAMKAAKMDPCQPNSGQTTAPPNCSKESALYVTLPPGAYTVRVNGVSSGTGVGIVEVYELQ